MFPAGLYIVMIPPTSQGWYSFTFRYPFRKSEKSKQKRSRNNSPKNRICAGLFVNRYTKRLVITAENICQHESKQQFDKIFSPVDCLNRYDSVGQYISYDREKEEKPKFLSIFLFHK